LSLPANPAAGNCFQPSQQSGGTQRETVPTPEPLMGPVDGTLRQRLGIETAGKGTHKRGPPNRSGQKGTREPLCRERGVAAPPLAADTPAGVTAPGSSLPVKTTCLPSTFLSVPADSIPADRVPRVLLPDREAFQPQGPGNVEWWFPFTLYTHTASPVAIK
jgi:hypothetical protein